MIEEFKAAKTLIKKADFLKIDSCARTVNTCLSLNSTGRKGSQNLDKSQDLLKN